MLKIKQLKGKVKYQDVIEKMTKHVRKVSENIDYEEIWFLEHKEVFTAGSSTPKDFKKKKINNIQVLSVNRGGKITYHGPGQLVIYPIINLKKRKMDLITFINIIEEICIEVFKNHSIDLYRRNEKNRGLWVYKNNEFKKIIFIGLRYSNGVVFHGLSINFKNNLENFRRINPCGLKVNDISSLSELKFNYDKIKIIKEIKNKFIEKFDYDLT